MPGVRATVQRKVANMSVSVGARNCILICNLDLATNPDHAASARQPPPHLGELPLHVVQLVVHVRQHVGELLPLRADLVRLAGEAVPSPVPLFCFFGDPFYSKRCKKYPRRPFLYKKYLNQ